MGLQVSAAFMGANSFHNQIETDRKILESRIRQWGLVPRLVMPGDFAVTPGPAHNVSIGAGMAFIPPKGLAVGSYFVYSDGADIVSLHTPTTNPFIDTVILRVADDQYGTVTGTKGARYDVIQGTPNASPVAPSDATIDALNVPGTWMRLCDVRVNTADTGVIPGGQFTTPFIRLAAAPAARIYQSAVQSLPNATVTQLLMDTILHDNDGMADLVNDRLNIVTPGLYLIYGGVAWAANVTGFRSMYVMVNALTQASNYMIAASGSFATIGNASTVIRLVAGDQVDVRAYQSSGGALNSAPTNGVPSVGALWVAP